MQIENIKYNDDMIEYLGYKAHAAFTFGDFVDGNNVYIVEHEGKFAYIEWAYGSCGGNDEIQACDTPQEMDALVKKRESQINWMNLDELKTFLNERDWELFTWYRLEEVDARNRAKHGIPSHISSARDCVLYMVNSILA